MTTEAAFWNNIAVEYSQKPVELPDAFERKIAITKGYIHPRDVVLDIGCGTGSLALRLAPSAGEVHGLDISSEMIRIAREKAQNEGSENTTFHVGKFDESFTTFEEGSLDGVCAYSILHLVEDRRAAMEQIFRLLKPGGFFISSTPCIGNMWIPMGPIISIMRLFGKAPAVVKSFKTDDLLHDMRGVGFVDIDTPDVGAKPTTAFVVANKPR